MFLNGHYVDNHWLTNYLNTQFFAIVLTKVDQEHIDNKIANQADKRLSLCRKGGLIAASGRTAKSIFWDTSTLKTYFILAAALSIQRFVI